MIRRLVTHRYMPLLLTLLAVTLCAPSLRSGLLGDDYYLNWVLTDRSLAPEWSRTAFDLFAFIPEDQELTRRAIDHGALPWWTHERLRFAFFRPLAGLTHWLDFRLWPSQLWLMHLHSLLWFGAAVAAAAVAYRRLLRPAGLAGLAALLYAVDEAHLGPAVWLACRNTAISTFFALVALIAHDRWRRDGWLPGRVVSPLALLLGLLGGEMALAAGGYLLAYALCLDRGRWQERFASLVPAGVVGAAWLIAYRALGYGVRHAGMYVDPGTSPLAYARAVVERGPLYLFGQWIGSAEVYAVMSERAAPVFWLVACGVVAVIAGLLLPVLKRCRTARFFALGMILSLLPVCSAVAQDRLLLLVGFGGMGLLAQFMAAVRRRAWWMPRSPLWWVPARLARGVLVVLHLVLAPLGVLLTSAFVHIAEDPLERAAASLPADPAVRHQQVVIVNTPSAFVSLENLLMQHANGRPVPARTLILGSGIYPIEVERRGDRVLAVRPECGFLAPPGSACPGEAEPPALNRNYAYPLLDRLFRGTGRMRLGQRIELTGVTVEITALTADGRPAEATFRFATHLDHPSLCWLEWRDGVYEPFAPPAVGEAVTLPAATVPEVSSRADAAAAADIRKQKRTVMDLRKVGTAFMSWSTDQASGDADAGAPLAEPDPKPGWTVRRWRSETRHPYSLISYRTVSELLVPSYIDAVPETDGWGHPYQFVLNADLCGSHVLGLRSAGRDGLFETDDYVIGSFVAAEFDRDLVWGDGYFIRWPAAEATEG